MPYRIIGVDLREYGPVETEEIREWIHEGRADANTLVCDVDDKQWVKLCDLMEVVDALPQKTTDGPQATIRINYLVATR